LVINPAAELLFRSNARAFAHLISFITLRSSILEDSKLKASKRRMSRRILKMVGEIDAAEIWLRAGRQEVTDLGVDKMPEAAPVLEEVERNLQKLRLHREKLMKNFDEIGSIGGHTELLAQMRKKSLDRIELSIARSRDLFDMRPERDSSSSE
jgi:hypothetical protein